MKQFILILGTRIRLSTITRYTENGENAITIYFNSSKNRSDFDVFCFENSEERDITLQRLDDLLL